MTAEIRRRRAVRGTCSAWATLSWTFPAVACQQFRSFVSTLIATKPPTFMPHNINRVICYRVVTAKACALAAVSSTVSRCGFSGGWRCVSALTKAKQNRSANAAPQAVFIMAIARKETRRRDAL